MFGLPNGMITLPGSTLDIGPNQMPLVFVTPPDNGFQFQPPAPDISSVPERQSNQTVTYSYPLYPYADKTHEYIQPGMIVFISKHIDTKYKIYNMVPVFKMNIMQNEAWKEFRASTNPKWATFRRLLTKFGEDVLRSHHFALKNGTASNNPELLEFYNLAKTSDFKYLTPLGILSSWNFAGTVQSKGESTGPAAYMDRHSNTDVVYVASLNTAKRSRTANIWGKARPGDCVKLILMRKNKDSPLLWVPYNCGSRDYPPRAYTHYDDPSGRTVESFVQPIGLVTEATQRDSTANQIDMALGYFNDNVKDAYEGYGSLAELILQIRI